MKSCVELLRSCQINYPCCVFRHPCVLFRNKLPTTLKHRTCNMGETRQEKVDLVEEYKDVFSGLGKLRGVKVKLHVDPDAKGAVQKQKRMSLPLILHAQRAETL